MGPLTRILALLLLVLGADAAHAALKCKVAATSLDFGLYSPLAAGPLDTAGTVTAQCQGGLGIVRFQLSAGSSGDGTNRLMQGPGGTLGYNIYLNSARTEIWGDGSAGTREALRQQTRRGRMEHEVTAYGRMPPGQDAAPGFYTDDIVVTVIF
jgi:spore coat protein U-like protein